MILALEDQDEVERTCGVFVGARANLKGILATHFNSILVPSLFFKKHALAQWHSGQ